MEWVDIGVFWPRIAWRDLWSLGKPRLSLLVLCTTGAGLHLAPGTLRWPRAFLILFATALVVGAANALNSYLERHSDALMERTRHRPLPAQRLSPRSALILSWAAAIVALTLLYCAANPLTALLAFAAFASYAWVYTPMKRYSWVAVLVGAIPGSIPPLMGWTAVTGHLSSAGWALFLILFFWQLPHFFAISTYLKEDYARGGLQVLPLVCGPRQTVWWTVAATIVLVPISLWPYYLGLASALYGWAALILGLGFVGVTCLGFSARSIERWARTVFLVSLGYLTFLMGFLVMGARYA